MQKICCISHEKIYIYHDLNAMNTLCGIHGQCCNKFSLRGVTRRDFEGHLFPVAQHISFLSRWMVLQIYTMVGAKMVFFIFLMVCYLNFCLLLALNWQMLAILWKNIILSKNHQLPLTWTILAVQDVLYMLHLHSLSRPYNTLAIIETANIIISMSYICWVPSYKHSIHLLLWPLGHAVLSYSR